MIGLPAAALGTFVALDATAVGAVAHKGPDALSLATLAISLLATVVLPYLVYKMNKRTEARMEKAATENAQASATKVATEATEEAIRGMREYIGTLRAEAEHLRTQQAELEMQLAEKDLRITTLNHTIEALENRMLSLQRVVAENWQLASRNKAEIEANATRLIDLDEQ